MSTRKRLLVIMVALGLLTAACGDDSAPADDTGADNVDESIDDTADASTSSSTTSSSSSTTTTTTAEAPPPVRILVTNDDGVGSDGIDQVVAAVAALDNVEVTVVAPAQNQSGSSNSVTDPAPTTADETTTASGYPALAVSGTPADAVNYALDRVFTDLPDLIISGSNNGQNIGPVAQLSGTVGAARTGAVRRVPGFAISQGGVTVEAEHETGIPFMIDWLETNLDDVLAFEGDLAPVWSLNTPSCGGAGEVRGLLEDLPLATEITDDEDAFSPDCTSTVEEVDDDVTAFVNGFASLVVIPEDLVTAAPEVRPAEAA